MNKTDALKWFDILHRLHTAGVLDTTEPIFSIAIAASPTNKRAIVLTYKAPLSNTHPYLQDFLTTAPQALQFLPTHLFYPNRKQ